MSARQDILEIKHDLLRLKANGTTNEILAGKFFENFITYASANWSYGKMAGGVNTTTILNSTGHLTVDCGGLRQVFKIIGREDLGLEIKDADQKRFITKPNLRCFDALAVGNIRNKGEASYNNGCFFGEHYFVKSYGVYYDPCMTAIYPEESTPVYARTKTINFPTPLNIPPIVLAKRGWAYTVLRPLPTEHTHGFASVYETFPLHDLKNNMSANDFEKAKNYLVKNDPQLITAGLK